MRLRRGPSLATSVTGVHPDTGCPDHDRSDASTKLLYDGFSQNFQRSLPWSKEWVHWRAIGISDGRPGEDYHVFCDTPDFVMGKLVLSD